MRNEYNDNRKITGTVEWMPLKVYECGPLFAGWIMRFRGGRMCVMKCLTVSHICKRQRLCVLTTIWEAPMNQVRHKTRCYSHEYSIHVIASRFLNGKSFREPCHVSSFILASILCQHDWMFSSTSSLNIKKKKKKTIPNRIITFVSIHSFRQHQDDLFVVPEETWRLQLLNEQKKKLLRQQKNADEIGV